MFISIAKRENNSKRNFIVVNKDQCKHVPTSPTSAINMFNALTEVVKNDLSDFDAEKTLCIGFAETATAIGAGVSSSLGCKSMQTTRENLGNVTYLDFEETHSHATQQRVVKDDLDLCISNGIDRIIFVEDEVTTGNTILSIINLIKTTYPSEQFKFGVASLINSMNAEHTKVYEDNGISIHFLEKTNNEGYSTISNSYENNGDYFNCEDYPRFNPYSMIEFKNFPNTRRLLDAGVYDKYCERLSNYIKNTLSFDVSDSILVLGTEEFMYSAIKVAQSFEENGFTVSCHSTTRSPIMVNTNRGYPLHKRFKLRSLYDDDRVTFIYDLQKYDKVLIVSDTDSRSNGLSDLVGALYLCGNTNITFVKVGGKF